jgi:hypothetical protein
MRRWGWRALEATDAWQRSTFSLCGGQVLQLCGLTAHATGLAG